MDMARSGKYSMGGFGRMGSIGLNKSFSKIAPSLSLIWSESTRL